MKTIIAITSAALLMLAAGQAAAQQDTAAPAISVSYADLDLSHASGRAALEQRIATAVKRVCPDQSRELRQQDVYRTCRDTAWSGARQQLAQIYSGRTFADAGVRVAAR